ncbi:MAG: DUF4340 domain-containing protein [Planctomycetota bacterium]
MSRTTLWVLIGLVSLLGLAAWRQLAVEGRQAQESEVRLFAGVDPARVERIRVEHLVRSLHVVFQRGEGGRWSMIEPHSAPANQGLVEHLFQTALERRGAPIPEARAEDLGLDPPRVILEMEEAIEGGTRRTRLDLGSIDLDGAHLAVRAGGRILRTWRDLDTTLDHGLEDFMSHEIVDVSPLEVVEVHRRGAIPRAGEAEARDVSFDAQLEEGAWRLTSPYSAALDPQGSALFVQSVTVLRVESYADFGRRLLADFGLDPPELSIKLGTVSAKAFTIRFGRPEHREGATWYASAEGMPYVWVVGGRAVELYAAPIEEFLDHALTRIPVSAVDAVSMELDGRELKLWLERPNELEKPRWMVSERPERGAASTPALEADRNQVEDLLGAIARVEFASFDTAGSLAEAEIRGSMVVQTGDLRQGGIIGGEVEGAEGGAALRVQRMGDSIVGLVDPAILEVMTTPARSLWRLVVVELVEIEQQELSLKRGEVSKRYVRGSKGLWTLPDLQLEAKELHAVLDGLMIVRASKHVAAESTVSLTDPIEVEATSTIGTKVKFVVGRVEGEAQVEFEGRRAVLKDQDLHARLAAILDRG